MGYDVLARLDNAWQARKAIELALKEQGNYDISVGEPELIRGDNGTTVTIYAAKVSFKWNLNGNEKDVKTIGAYVRSPDGTKWSFVVLPLRFWNQLVEE